MEEPRSNARLDAIDWIGWTNCRSPPAANPPPAPTPDDPVHLLPAGIGFQGQRDFFLDNATARCRVQHP
jgi:hypothetical protein